MEKKQCEVLKLIHILQTLHHHKGVSYVQINKLLFCATQSQFLSNFWNWSLFRKSRARRHIVKKWAMLCRWDLIGGLYSIEMMKMSSPVYLLQELVSKIMREMAKEQRRKDNELSQSVTLWRTTTRYGGGGMHPKNCRWSRSN